MGMRRLTPLVLCTALTCFAAYGASSDAQVQESDSEDEVLVSLSQTQIEAELWDALEKLKTVSPVLYEKVRNCPHDKQIRVMLRSLGIDVRTEKPPEPKLVEPPPVYPAKLIFENTMFYVRLDALNAPQLKQLREDVTTSARLRYPPEIAVIDLRNTGVTAEKDVLPELLQFLTEQMCAAKSFLNTCAVITSSETAPRAQLLAAILQKRRLAINIGQPSKYPVYPMAPLQVHGGTIYVPVFQDSDIFCVKTTVLPVKALPMVPYERFGKALPPEGKNDGNHVRYDAAIQYAHDCLIAVRILSQGLETAK